MSPTMRRASGRSTRSSTRRSSSRIATRVSRALPLISISRFKATSLVRSLAGGLLLTGMITGAAPLVAQTLQYPDARKSDVVDVYHGTRVADPYRWLEDPDAPESRAWIEAQNRVTEAYLAAIPAR